MPATLHCHEQAWNKRSSTCRKSGPLLSFWNSHYGERCILPIQVYAHSHTNLIPHRMKEPLARLKFSFPGGGLSQVHSSSASTSQ